jgi:glycerophosphoryl diester phosphodiesterase
MQTRCIASAAPSWAGSTHRNLAATHHAPRDFCLIGHRCVVPGASENTIASFDKAIALGAEVADA